MISDEAKTFCQNCSRYIESSKYVLHERMCSLNVKRCPKCDKPFNLDDLDEHLKLDHTLVACDLCGNKYIVRELENHKMNCEYRLITCKFCELSVIFQELEEHENICGSTTKLCEKCGLFIEKKNFENHICEKQESQYLNEYIQFDVKEEDKKEKKKIKNKKNKKNKPQNNVKENEIMNNINNDMDDLDLNMVMSSKEMYYQIKALKKFEDKKNKEINNKKVEDKKVEDKKEQKNKKNKKKKEKEKEKEDEKEEETKNNKKNKRGKKNKIIQNKNNKDMKDYSDDDENYYPSNKKRNLHNIKFDLPPEEYENYNKKIKALNYEYNSLRLEEEMISEAIKQSLIEK